MFKLPASDSPKPFEDYLAVLTCMADELRQPIPNISVLCSCRRYIVSTPLPNTPHAPTPATGHVIYPKVFAWK